MRFFLSSLFKLTSKHRRRKLRIIVRGYRILKKQDRLALPLKLKNVLSQTPLKRDSQIKVALKQVSFNIDLSIRQYLSVRILGVSFNKSLLYSIGAGKAVAHPLPKEWVNVLERQNEIEVNKFHCTILWHLYSLLFWTRGVLKLLGSAPSFLKSTSHANRERCVYFSNLTQNNISNDPGQNNIINWYLGWKNRQAKFNSICHDVRNFDAFDLGGICVVQSSDLPHLSVSRSLRYLIFIVFYTLYASCICLFKPIHGFLLLEIIKLKKARLSKKSDLALDYLFHNSDLFYRPLWTYIAEQKGSRVLFYFYSTNNEAFKLGKESLLPNLWRLMSWSHYLVWDEFQKDFVKTFESKDPKIENVGPIYFSDCVDEIEIPVESVSVFDVTPVRLSRYVVLGADSEYYIPEVVNQFLNDIQKVLLEQNWQMIHKMKRRNIYSHKKYCHNISMLETKNNYKQVNSDLSATEVIRRTKATISLPFTSTASIAKFENTPSVYYDPSGLVQKDDRAAHGIPVLSGIEELKEWVEGIDNE